MFSLDITGKSIKFYRLLKTIHAALIGQFFPIVGKLRHLIYGARKHMRGFTKFINVIFTLVACVGFIWLSVALEEHLELLRTFASGNGGKIMFVVAVGAILLNLYNIYRSIRIMRSRQRAIEVDGKNGKSSISIDAVQRRIHEILAKADDVSSPRVNLEITGKGKPIKCGLEFCLQSTSNITGRADELKQTVREAFVRLIPGGPGIEISASVLDLANVKSTQTQSSSSDFSGPVYPTSGDSSNHES